VRTIPPALSAALASDTLTLAVLTTLTRADGKIVRMAGHDRDIMIDGVTWHAAASADPGHVERPGGLAAASSGLTGALTSDAVSDADLKAGRWLGARVELAVTDWTAPDAILPVWTGTIASTIQRDGAFELELEGLEAGLDAMIGRRFMRQCDARLGDSRCGVSLQDPRYRGEATLLASHSDRSFTVTAPAGLLVERLERGSVCFSNGPLSGLRYRLASAAVTANGLTLALATPLPLPVEAGAALVLEIACDGALATCRDVFANAINHRGCPHMPGPSASFAGPQTDVSGGRP
jgi:uncharacterized phage protein (TIGR02218 family)